MIHVEKPKESRSEEEIDFKITKARVWPTVISDCFGVVVQEVLRR